MSSPSPLILELSMLPPPMLPPSKSSSSWITRMDLPHAVSPKPSLEHGHSLPLPPSAPPHLLVPIWRLKAPHPLPTLSLPMHCRLDAERVFHTADLDVQQRATPTSFQLPTICSFQATLKWMRARNLIPS